MVESINIVIILQLKIKWNLKNKLEFLQEVHSSISKSLSQREKTVTITSNYFSIYWN